MTKTKKSNSVFAVSIGIILIIVIWCVAFPGSYQSAADNTYAFLTGKFGWFYDLSMGAFLFFCIWLSVSKFGKIRLGEDDSRPEYSTVSWFAMLFSAGMGIGLIFWGIAEPLTHFMAPLNVLPGTPEAAEFAINKAFLHWALHPWSCYALMGLALAYMQFRKKKAGLISSIFIPLIGEERVNSWIGKTIDIFAVFATISGGATSLGLGTLQINSGFHYLFHIPVNKVVQTIIILITSFLFILSAVSGLDKGIRILSNTNLILGFLLLALAFIVGPTVLSLNALTEGMGTYFQNIIQETFRIGAFKNSDWYGRWTIFYWAWWIAWAPFVGSFIARISKGRTIREFLAGALLAPSLFSFIWFAVFGRMGINLGTKVASEAIASTPTACFVVFSHYPLALVLSGLTILLVITFYITSADSSTFVLGIFTSGGNLNPKIHIKVIWGIMEGSLALVLLLVSTNGLKNLQTISIVGAFPFTFIMLGSIAALLKSLKNETMITACSDKSEIPEEAKVNYEVCAKQCLRHDL